ncbi:MAG: TetR/AcrR family transcriptional regulator [Thermobacillus sp.]|uniref:TetR/AcrR family transcriptional regulator n=1 Tax=Thermobacillus sp. TaxID=2108467 RepID=UPI000E37DB6C|nr:TetR/AcrR family transcriptional regulator [Thermobacillus sp.]REK54088.1 MAG: TetR/AcrR family transcriptional regulator [Thermobacillus sp.]
MKADGPDVKTRILTAAKKLFARHGYEATTVRQICEEAGANIALISYHFGGKENVFAALFETALPHRRIEEAIAQPMADPAEAVRQIVAGVVAFQLSEPEMIAIMQQETMIDSPRRDLIRKHAFPVWRRLLQAIEEGRKQGIFSYGSKDHALLSVLGAILFQNKIDHFGPLLDIADPAEYYERLTEELTAFVLRGLGYTGA